MNVRAHLPSCRVHGNASGKALGDTGMKGLSTLTLFAALAASPLLAQGPVGTLERGAYACELPGDAAGAAGIPKPDANFTIIGASRYTSAQGHGTYLRRGDVVTFTSGPRSGEAYAVISSVFLRRMENGRPGELRCIRKSG